jgi:predicted Zn finger-like uncharacterized protein
MIVTCPACATRYVVDPAALGPKGRTVRCARCADTWLQAPPPDVSSEPTPVSAPIVTPTRPTGATPSMPTESMPSFIGKSSGDMPNLPALRTPPRLVHPVHTGWAALVGFVVIFLGSLFLFRPDITTAWPATQRLYNLVGLTVPGIDDWLKVREPRSAYNTIDGQSAVTISGEIVNVSAAARSVPKLRITLLNAQNEMVTNWTFQPSEAPLQPGGALPFSTSNPVATGNVTTVNVNWAPE